MPTKLWPQPIQIPMMLGEASRKSNVGLQPGELLRSVGLEYRRMDDRLWVVKGRELVLDLGSDPVRGIQAIQFDDGSTYILVMAGTSIWSVNVGTLETQQLDSGKNPDSSFLSAAHLLDRWYITTGFDHDLIVMQDTENPGLLKSKQMGMAAPQQALSVSAQFIQGTTARPDSYDVNSGTWFTPEKAYDNEAALAIDNTFGGSTVNGDTGQASIDYSFSDTNAAVERRLKVRVECASGFTPSPGTSVIDEEWSVGFDATIEVHVTQNANAAEPDWETVYSRRVNDAQPMRDPDQISVFAVSANNDISVKCRIVKHSGTTPVTMRVYDILVTKGGIVGAIDTGDRVVRWAYTEIDEETGSESKLSEEIGYQFAGENYVTLLLPDVPQNAPRTTSRIIYRTPPILPDNTGAGMFGRVARISASDTTWNDDFTTPLIDEQALPLYQMVQVGDLLFTALDPPPLLDYITVFQGVLIGVKGRSLYRSMGDYPEAWPAALTTQKIPVPENDNFISCQQVNNKLILLGHGVVIGADDIVRFPGNSIVVPTFRRISDVGCVGEYAFCKMTRGGESEEVLAWVSPFGIHLTDGSSSQDLASQINWPSLVDTDKLKSAVLHWDRDRQVLIFAYDSDGDGTNDRYALIHMAVEHRRKDGNPPVTIGHYGVINDLTSLTYNGVETLWAGHSNGSIYRENVGDIDESYSLDALGSIPFDIANTFDGEWLIAELIRGRIRFDDGQGQLVEIVVSTHLGSELQAVNALVTVDDDPTEFFIGIAGDRISTAIGMNGKGNFAIKSFELDANARSGRGASLGIK